MGDGGGGTTLKLRNTEYPLYIVLLTEVFFLLSVELKDRCPYKYNST